MLKVVLRPITSEVVNDYYAIKALKDWRIKNRFAYLGDYEVTMESIVEWLFKYVFADQRRLLFWVLVEGKKVGHIGVKNIKRSAVEIDNVARGVEGYKGVMTKALEQIIEMYSDRKIWLRVLDDNPHAISFYIKNKFKKRKHQGRFIFMDYDG